MYRNGFLLTVKRNGKTLREVKNREVYIPFNSEYSLSFKNDNNRRAAVSVKIDGTDVLGDRELIIDAYSTFDLERFLTDGDLNTGRKFKFVPATSGQVQDPSSPENGLIEVEFWLEKPQPVNITWTTTNNSGGCWNYREFPNTNRSVKTKSFMPDSGLYGSGRFGHNVISFQNTSDAYMSTATISANVSNVGATIEGGKSSQRFQTVTFGEREYPSTVLKLWMRGLDKEITTNDKLYCVRCGKSLSFDYKFCPSCGTSVVIE